MARRHVGNSMDNNNYEHHPITYILKHKDRPFMIFDSKVSLVQVYFYIKGIYMGNLIGHSKTSFYDCWIGVGEGSFHEFVAKETEMTNTTRPWYQLIEFNTSTYQESFDRFYRLLEEYLASRGGRPD